MDDLIPNFRDENVQSAVKNLVFYSIVILAVPLGSMFFLKRFFFEGIMGVESKDSMTYAAVIAVILVHVVLDIGFAKEIEEDRLFSLRSQYFPLGKIGGKPSWLNPIHLPSTSDLSCSKCKKPMAFLMQIYATHQACPPHAFHRTIYIFICRNNECSVANQASNIRAFRCQLPRENPYYSAAGPVDPDLDGEVPDPFFDPSKYPKLCVTCGCKAASMCGKCKNTWYCSRDHQVLDWKHGHKVVCELAKEVKMENDEISSKKPKVEYIFLFPEYGMELSWGYMPLNVEDSDCEDECEEDEDEDKLAIKLNELKQYETQNGEISARDLEGLEETPKDVTFKKFHKILSRDPEQIMRYDRNGSPLLATDLAPSPSSVPACDLCSAPRSFELQITPHLLSLMEVDTIGSSIDWATVLIYTCSKDCAIPESGYTKEYVFKQDFVLEQDENVVGQNVD